MDVTSFVKTVKSIHVSFQNIKINNVTARKVFYLAAEQISVVGEWYSYNKLLFLIVFTVRNSLTEETRCF